MPTNHSSKESDPYKRNINKNSDDDDNISDVREVLIEEYGKCELFQIKSQ